MTISSQTISAVAQDAGSAAQPIDSTAQRISEIISTVLKEGEITLPNGGKAFTRIPPSNEAVAEVKAMGTKAIPALVQHLNALNPREQELAIRFLGIVGGEGVVKPLGTVVLKSQYGTARLMALDILSEAPWSSVREYVQYASTDTDPAVRKKAVEIQSAHQ